MWFSTNNIDSHSIEGTVYNIMFININIRVLRLRSTDWKSSLNLNITHITSFFRNVFRIEHIVSAVFVAFW